MQMLWLGLASLIVGLILLAVAGYSYYEVHEHKPIPVGLEGLIMKYRMWLAIGGGVLVLLGGGLMAYDYSMKEGGGALAALGLGGGAT